MANTPHQPPGPPPKEPPKPGAPTPAVTVPPHPSTTVTAAATHSDNPHTPYTQAAVYHPTGAEVGPSTMNPDQYKTPKDFHLAKQGSRDYVAGQPVDEAELKKVDEEHDKKVDEAKKAADEAKKASEALQKGEPAKK